RVLSRLYPDGRVPVLPPDLRVLVLLPNGLREILEEARVGVEGLLDQGRRNSMVREVEEAGVLERPLQRVDEHLPGCRRAFREVTEVELVDVHFRHGWME